MVHDENEFGITLVGAEEGKEELEEEAQEIRQEEREGSNMEDLMAQLNNM